MVSCSLSFRKHDCPTRPLSLFFLSFSLTHYLFLLALYLSIAVFHHLHFSPSHSVSFLLSNSLFASLPLSLFSLSFSLFNSPSVSVSLSHVVLLTFILSLSISLFIFRSTVERWKRGANLPQMAKNRGLKKSAKNL